MPTLATVATFGFADFDPPVILDLYRRLGCRRSQFYRNPDNQPDERDVVRICADAGVPIDSMHGLFGDEYDPSSLDEERRRATVEAYRAEADVAHRIGGPMVVVHPAPLNAAAHPLQPGEEPRRLEALARSMDELAELGRELGVVYLIENLPNEAPLGRDPVELARMIRRVGSDHLRLCFDAGHALVTAAAPTPAAAHAGAPANRAGHGGAPPAPTAPAERLAACADVIGYVHIHDNDGRSDSHLMPGDGRVDWPAVGDALRRTGLELSAMLEVFYLRDKLAGYLDHQFPRRLAQWLGTRGPAA